MVSPKLPRIDDALLKQFAEGRLDSEIESWLALAIEKSLELQARVAAISSNRFLEKVKQAAVASRAAGSDASFDQKTAESIEAVQPDGIPQELLDSRDYQVLKELGRGGMGVVYLAKYVPMDRVEVLKVLSEQLVKKGSAKQRFRNEMRAIGKLNHPAIATAYQQVPLPTQLVFSMEYVPGIDLHRFIRKYHPVPIPVACALAFQIAGALQHANSKQTVHRDIKPSNVMVFKEDGNLRIKILDFGLAKASSERDSEGLTVDGTMLGTPEYMAPEQALNAAKADIRADIYSLGCTLYHLLMGKPPFAGTFQSILMAHAQQEADYISFSRLDVPVELSEIIAKMMAKNPSERYATPKQVAEALKPFAGKASVKSHIQLDPAKIDTHFDLALPSRETSIEQPSPTIAPVLAPAGTPQRSVAASIADLKVEDRRFTKSILAANRPRNAAGRFKLPPRLAIAIGGSFLAILLAGVLMLRTGEGTLVIENLPADAEVFVDQESIRLRWNEGKETATVRVKPGTRHVEVRSGGARIAGETVTIDRGDKIMISVSVAPAVHIAAKEAPATKSNADSQVPGTSSGTVLAKFDDLFSPGGSWINVDESLTTSLTILSRNGESFRALVSAGQGLRREVHGKIAGNEISWLAKDVHVIVGKAGGDNTGTISQDGAGPRIDFRWSGPGAASGTFTLRPDTQLVPPSDAILFHGSRYKLFPEKLSWHDARNRCSLMGGNLAVISSRAENDFIFGMARTAGLDSVWLGASDEHKEGDWNWITGDSLRYRNWGTHQPNNLGSGEDFMLLIVNYPSGPSLESRWVDQPNESLQKQNPGYICQWFGSQPQEVNAAGFKTDAVTKHADVAPIQPKPDGFVSLFDGTDTSAWQSLGPFKVREGTLVANDEKGFAISKDEYENFELIAEWKIGPGANSGIYYREISTRTSAGTEYQIIDESGFADAMKPELTTGAIRRVAAPESPHNTSLGVWHSTRIVCSGPKAEHWLDGKKLLEYDTSTSEWQRLLSDSNVQGQMEIKFLKRGHILLQARGGEIAFRAIRIKQLPLLN
ncbi:Serine/threonine-protein kinase PknE [Rosistilla carotiformis]|uniref:Serine/threonine-protein kinase PknE n=1 Tax=Rosistilla carotiformis TaxID=2528017 RepID=A0A518JRE7_9BACT|nr:family 16 glycoside hydrolase [Rosistilla carotiformis]QDV68117.1 Serine/threonine-protein kinase PknE [Rosistilla carotiformis]